MFKFDLHVATETCTDTEFTDCLSDLGLTDDELVDRHVTFYKDIAISACPLIGLHLSKKYHALSTAAARAKINSDILGINGLFKKHRVTGYAHAEATSQANDITLKSNQSFNDQITWPVSRFKPSFSETNKQWDIHIAIPVDELPERLAIILEDSGMYSIDLLKHRDGICRRFRVYTIQSIQPGAEGQFLYNALVEWFQAASPPHVEIKLEHYLAMIRSGNPKIVPPTIGCFELASQLDSTCLATQTHSAQFV
ncbi:MAG TPA: hypothetical protein V6C69_14690 [Trichormus sp.]|jgi:hypothetical protein